MCVCVLERSSVISNVNLFVNIVVVTILAPITQNFTSFADTTCVGHFLLADLDVTDLCA